MHSCLLIECTAITAFAAAVTAIASVVLAYSAYMAHKIALGYFARVFVSVYLCPEDDIAEEENIGDESRKVVALVKNYDNKPVKIQSVQYYYKNYMLVKEKYKDTNSDILSVTIKDLDGIVIEPNKEHRYERNLAEVKKQASGRKHFYVSVKHSISPKPVTEKLRLS